MMMMVMTMMMMILFWSRFRHGSSHIPATDVNDAIPQDMARRIDMTISDTLPA